MKKMLYFVALIMSLSIHSYAQQISHLSINSIAGNFQGQEVNVSLTIGELVVDQFDFGGISLGSGTAIYTSIDVITSLDEGVNSILQIFPNPTEGLLNIKIAYGIEQVKIDLINSNGQVLTSKVLYQTSTLSLENYPQGIFILKVQNLSNSKVAFHKIIKR